MDTLGKFLFGWMALASAINGINVIGGKTVQNRIVSAISMVIGGLVIYYVYTH